MDCSLWDQAKGVPTPIGASPASAAANASAPANGTEPKVEAFARTSDSAGGSTQIFRNGFQNGWSDGGSS